MTTEISADPATNPSVSVIVPAYNAAGTLTAVLEAVYAQTFPILEVIVVDDGSQDDTAALLRERFPQVKYVRQAQQGVSAARNRGAAEARGDYLAFLDADDVWHPDKLARQVAALQQTPDLDLLLTRAIRVYPTGRRAEPSAVGLPELLPLTLDLWLSRRQRDRLSVYGCVSSWVMPRAAFVASGGFDPLWATANDHEYVLRLLGRGRRAAVLTAALFDYHMSAGSLSHRPDRDRYLATSKRVLQAWATVPFPPQAGLSERERGARIIAEVQARVKVLLGRGYPGACAELLAAGRPFVTTPSQRVALALWSAAIRLAGLLGGRDGAALHRLHSALRWLRWNLARRR
ncbi:MAG: glycosyltransferase family 2 protein [Armatimonadota bacterium]